LATIKTIQRGVVKKQRFTCSPYSAIHADAEYCNHDELFNTMEELCPGN
jgi:hypothetical protein